ncbi:ZDH14-like protein [Mya arenaria]|uniref:Palmitoyltransferase n=1 Tax=Mya arenaria TaxID=6604 RepID=A0ABY7FSB4_MYAAR|nr:ZDH14-like protein [Mya arenaria]
MANSKVNHSPQKPGANNNTAAMGEGQGSNKLQRKWEVYPGRNKFFCNGRIVSSPDIQGFLCCMALIIVTDCPYLAVKVHPVIPVVGGVLFILIIGCLVQTTFIDPGIIPRATLPEALETDRLYQLECQNQENAANNGAYQPPRYKEVMIKGRQFKLSYCQTCQMYRPPRASHCSRCNNCVERFDHHCPMVSNCIGKRNYRYFYLFVTFTALMCCYVLGCNVAVIVLRAKDTDIGEAFKKSAGSIIEGVICLGCLASVGGLSCYHSMLVCKEQTTNEDIKGTYNPRKFKDASNPYSHGNFITNCCAVLCGPRHPSLIDRRGFVDPSEDTQAIVDTANARGRIPES